MSENGGKKPKWHQEFKFDTNKTNLKVEVKDEGMFDDPEIGTGFFNLSSQQFCD